MSKPIHGRLLVTGAAGRIGRAISPALAQRWDLVRTDLRSDDGCAVLDVTDLSACRAAFAGADAVVHLAAEPGPHASWDRLLPANVVGAYNVVQAAMDASVPRLVLASSVHTGSGYPLGRQFRAEDAPMPANLYGATKAWAEALGAWAATVSQTSVVALRIGYFAGRPPSGNDVTPQDRAAWLSPGDCARLFIAAVEAQDVRYFVATGTSANRYTHQELSTTSAVLGYAPMDDAWT